MVETDWLRVHSIKDAGSLRILGKIYGPVKMNQVGWRFSGCRETHPSGGSVIGTSDYRTSTSSVEHGSADATRLWSIAEFLTMDCSRMHGFNGRDFLSVPI